MKELEGDILLVERGIICHQVNCLGIMGGGIALEIRNKYPELYSEYRKNCVDNTGLLGSVSVYTINENLKIANIFGQQNIGIGKGIRTDYDAVDKSLIELKKIINEDKTNLPIYFPKYMGCGLGGGNWSIYKEIIRLHFPDGIIISFVKGKIPS